MQVNSETYYLALKNAAKGLIAAEKRGQVPDTPQFDFGVTECCAACQQPIRPPKKVLRCGACKAVIYCSKECSKSNWNYSPIPRAPTHKQLCADNKRHMERLPDTQAITKLFPWGRIEKDGTFNDEIARGRFDVLGSSGCGFWNHRGGPIPHQNQGIGAALQHHSASYSAQAAKLLANYNHIEGRELLLNKHLTDEEGWKLSPNLIPYRHFPSPEKRPVLVTDLKEPVKDWESWYKWRGIPLDSPAALLMNFPMSVYQLLVYSLGVAHPKAGSVDKRIPLHVHMLGTEVELNYLPLFSELALLLPYYDIKLVLFSGSVHTIVTEAKKMAPASVAGKSSPKTPVFTYKAPKESGSGSISLFLHGESTGWAPAQHLGPSSPYGGNLDAIVACNAGLTSYAEWTPVIQAAHALEIPFATTEYAEQSAESQRVAFPIILQGRVPPRKEYPIELNPFQRPGQRGVPTYRVPNVPNGFTLVVVKKDDNLVDKFGELGLDSDYGLD